MNTVRKRLPAARAGDACEDRHRPLRSLVWQLFGGFVAVVLTLALAGAAQLGVKSDAADVDRLEARVREGERVLGDIRDRLAELRAGQEHMREDLVYIRGRLDEER